MDLDTMTSDQLKQQIMFMDAIIIELKTERNAALDNALQLKVMLNGATKHIESLTSPKE